MSRIGMSESTKEMIPVMDSFVLFTCAQLISKL
jgi:hypothetical protein